METPNENKAPEPAGIDVRVDALVMPDRGPITPAYLAELERKASFLDAVQNAAKVLPDGWLVTMWIENGYGGFGVRSPNGEEQEVDADGRTLADQLNAIVEVAASVGRINSERSKLDGPHEGGKPCLGPGCMYCDEEEA